MTCMGMSGNGVRMSGIETMMVLLQMEGHGKVEVPPPEFTGVAAGNAMPCSAGLRIASSSVPSTTATSLVSVS
jgi:hypothetical protein